MNRLTSFKCAIRLMIWAAVLSMMALGVNLSAANAAGSPNPAPTSPVSTVMACPGFMPSWLIAGQQGRVTPGIPNHVRLAPASTVIGHIPGGGRFRVLAGPQCSAGSAWWLVDYQGLVGWTSEGIGYTYYLEPVALPMPSCPGFLPSRLVPGGWGRVTLGTPNRLRTAPYGATLGLIPGGATFGVLSGPVCGWRTAWWLVNYSGIVGWTREGTSGDYWLEPVH
jgi:hypothetical protein